MMHLTPKLLTMDSNANTFDNGEITVNYNPKICIHAEKCCKELKEVFRTSVIPWIDLDAAPTNKIITQVKKCPSGALSYCKSESLSLVK